MSPERDPLEELLVREPYIDDGGFTSQVMAKLPSPRRDLRPLVLGLSGAVAAGLAVVYLPGAMGELLEAVGAAARLALPAGVAPATGAVVLACLASLAAAVLMGAGLARRT
jgi:hypothetical protein